MFHQRSRTRVGRVVGSHHRHRTRGAASRGLDRRVDRRQVKVAVGRQIDLAVRDAEVDQRAAQPVEERARKRRVRLHQPLGIAALGHPAEIALVDQPVVHQRVDDPVAEDAEPDPSPETKEEYADRIYADVAPALGLEGTYPFTITRSAKAWRINNFLHSIVKPEFRERFKTDFEALAALLSWSVPLFEGASLRFSSLMWWRIPPVADSP